MPLAPTATAWTIPRSDPNDRFVADLVRESANATRGYGLFGVPFDGAVIGRPGAKEGPAAIRAALAPLKPWTAERGELRFALRDFGDAAGWTDTASAHRAAEEAARAVLAAGLVPVALGGDHSLGYPLVKAHEGRVGVINIDAHLDVRDVVGGKITSGTPFGRLLEDGVVRGANLVEVGARDFATSPAYAAKAAKHGVRVVGVERVRQDPDAVAREAVATAAAGTGGVYVSLDVDVLDAAHAPGVSAPTPGGLSTSELYAFLRSCAREISARSRLAGFDLVEVAPSLDEGGRTARAAAFALLHFLAAAEAAR